MSEPEQQAPPPGASDPDHPDYEVAARLSERITQAWLAKDADTSYPMTETYPYGARLDHRPVLAQRLHDEGLLYAINRLVLHGAGLALGVGVNAATLDREAMRGEVWDLNLNATGDPDGFSYGDPEIVLERNVAKLRAAGHGELADRVEALGP